MKIPFFIVCVLVVLGACTTNETSETSAENNPLVATYQTRDSNDVAVLRKQEIDPTKIGIVIIDMWNFHWCKTSAARVSAMVPRMNASLDEARKMGMQVFLCPTDVANNYAGTPQRENAIAVEKLPLPESLNIECPHPGGGGCMCGEDQCVGNGGWDGMAGDLVIREDDLISSGPEELYALCKKLGITELWYMGVHTNNCVLGKPEGMRNMMNYGLKCVLVRDLQDPETFYDPAINRNPDINNAIVVRHFEKYLAPSINFVSFLEENNRWNEDLVVNPVRITPWGKPERSHQFKDKQIITLTTPYQDSVEIRYTLDSTEPSSASALYTQPFAISETTTLRAMGFRNGKPVNIESTGLFTKLSPPPPKPSVFLSSLELLDLYRTSREPVMNKSFVGKPLQIRGQVYKNGVGTLAPSFLTYAIRPEFKAFTALCALDDNPAADEWGREKAKYPSVVYKIFIDGKLVDQSPVMRHTQWPWRFHVPIPPGSRIINLVATNAGDGSFYDYADWLDAGFITE